MLLRMGRIGAARGDGQGVANSVQFARCGPLASNTYEPSGAEGQDIHIETAVLRVFRLRASSAIGARRLYPRARGRVRRARSRVAAAAGAAAGAARQSHRAQGSRRRPEGAGARLLADRADLCEARAIPGDAARCRRRLQMFAVSYLNPFDRGVTSGDGRVSRLPRPLAQIGDQTLLAQRAAGEAGVATVQDEPVVGVQKGSARARLPSASSRRRAGSCRAPGRGAVADPEDGGIDGDGRLAKGNIEHHVCGLRPMPGSASSASRSCGTLPPCSATSECALADHVLRLGAIKADGLDQRAHARTRPA